VVCRAATNKFYAAEPPLRYWARWNLTAARFGGEALANLRAPRPPVADRALVAREYSLAQREIDNLRRSAAASLAGDLPRDEALNDKRIDLTHRRDLLRYLPDDCPVGLPS
jgi:hypothetical protein